MSDFSEAEQEAITNNMKKLYGQKTHAQYLHKIKRSLYVCLSTENTVNQYSSLHSHMYAQLAFPYYVGNSTTPLQYSQTTAMNDVKHNFAINIGAIGLEVGGYKRMYARTDLGYSQANGRGNPLSLRTCIGYNIKVLRNDFVIFRPELAFTYLNRNVQFQEIVFAGSQTMSIYGNTITQYKKENLSVTLCENVFNLSPSIGIWLLPYKSRFVLRFNVGYNYTLSQYYSVLFSGSNDLREHLNSVNIQFFNTNGQTTNFFKYSGLFANITIGIRMG